MLDGIFSAFFLQSGYNATLVTIGACLLGIAAGTSGTFLFLRKRALISDAVAHATLPGVAIAFMIMVFLGGDGRNLAGLLLGSAISSLIGLLAVGWITRYTRLAEDAAIGAVLSVFFGAGIVLLTVIQSMSSGRQAGLESFLLGSTAGMLFQDAVTIAIGGAMAVLAVFILRRPMTLAAFDPEYATSTGQNVYRTDLATMGLVMAVTVIGLKIVGLILIVALLIIPAVTARFFSERAEHVVILAGVFGGAAGYIGSAISASAPDLPTGPIIVLVSFGLFCVSLFFAPERGIFSALLRHRRFQLLVHRRQGLLAIAHGERIYDPLTLSTLRKAGFLRPDGVATDSGTAQASKTLRDERRWQVARVIYQDDAVSNLYDGLTPIEAVLTHDQIAEIDRNIPVAKQVDGDS
ncbi:MAG: metal ABC transporter permease [Pseudomonadota bacterium]